MTTSDSFDNDRLRTVGLRIICICLFSDDVHNCVYRVYTSDGGFVEYIGFDKVPLWVKDWMQERNAWDYVVPSCMLISGCKVV